MRTILFIDTTDSARTIIGLEYSGKRYEKSGTGGSQKSQAVLPLIHDLLAQQKITLSQLTAIEVNPGPGSYTGIRIGIAVARMLGVLLGIAVNNTSATATIEPIYEDSKFT